MQSSSAAVLHCITVLLTTTMITKILVINPNSSQSMTRALGPILADLLHRDLLLRYHTGPVEAPPSVNDWSTSVTSAAYTFGSLHLQLGSARAEGEEESIDAYLVACFSDHPLVGMLREHTTKPVLGIFEASIMHALALGQPFGIVTTGSYWEVALTEGVKRIFGSADLGGAFVGVESTGMTALELHKEDPIVVADRIAAAASRLVAKGARSIIMGCAGMSGMEEAVRAGCKGENIRVVDAVRSGVTTLESVVRANR
ncbi:Asp/Glu/hydantoin racemase [Daedaleopsis nitida]|nr:Asp/Glu/hydantoin racemase [Daedaleopsis nitida]